MLLNLSGVSSLDYFVSLEAELEEAQKGYSEKLHLMSDLGTQFTDRYKELYSMHKRQPRTVLLDRLRIFSFSFKS